MFLAEGRLIEEGPAGALLDEPGKELTRRFLRGELLY
jgi:ABC-type phosphate transport system ATPase subunit